MKKIGIITLHGYTNYGNKLQNYALKYYLEKLGFEVSTIIVKKNDMYKIRNLNLIDISTIIKNRLVKIFNKEQRIYMLSQQVREIKFKKFSSKYLDEIFLNYGDNTSIDEFDFFITGSDQVWHPAQVENFDIYFLKFVEKNKRVAYAPSMSTDKIPENLIQQYKDSLNGMASISIREEKGAKLINDLINEEVPVLVDPTLLLNKNEWLSIGTKAPNKPEKDYILTYFLGGPTSETKKEIEKIASERNMKIINLGDRREKTSFETGPGEFIDYINNASLFYTDSFHGVVFSIIMKTPFLVFKRRSKGSSMYSRIETLLAKFSYQNREFERFDGDLFSMDFSGVGEILNKESQKTLEYLNKTLHIGENEDEY